MRVLVYSCVCVIFSFSFMRVTRSDQNDEDKDLTSLIQTYIDARKLYQYVQTDTKNDDEEIDAVEKEIGQLLKQMNGGVTQNPRHNMNRLARNWDFGDDYDAGARATDSTSTKTTTTMPTSTTTTTTTTAAATAAATTAKPSIRINISRLSSWFRRIGR